MMERKAKYMPIWGRYVDIFDKLTQEQMGELFHAMMHYHFDGTEPELTGVLAIYWDFLKPDLDNAQISYKKKVESGRKGGKHSAEVRRKKKELEATSRETKQTEAELRKMKQTEAELRKMKQTQQRTRTESRTESESESRSETQSQSETDYGSAPAEAGLSLVKRAYGEFGWVQLTDRQYRQLQARMGEQTLGECIRYIDRSAQSTGNRNRWKDWYLILLRCYEEGWHRPRQKVFREQIPYGATGELGEAELEAIRQVLNRDIPDDFNTGEMASLPGDP